MIAANAMPPLRYAITDRTQYGNIEAERRAGLIAQAERLAADRVDFIQLREKDLPAQDLIGLAREILNAIRPSGSKTHGSGTRLLINGRPDVALASAADGVHLPSGADQLTPAQARHLFENAGAPRPAVSVSCHTLDEVERAREGGADLILFGPVFGKSVFDKSLLGKPVHPGTGLEALAAACERARDTPVLALGGVTAANAATTIAAGARGFAAIRLFR
jgi:thiamine-phosphate pyrophosphorylase